MGDLFKTKRKNENEIAFIKQNWVTSTYSEHLIYVLIKENREIKSQLRAC